MKSILVTLIAALMSCLSVFNTVQAPADESDFVPVLRFMVASDSHVGAIASERAFRVQRAIRHAYSDAAQDKNYTALDAVLFAGDLTDGGNRFQFLGFWGAVQSALQPGTVPLGIVAKSHDGSALGKASLPYYEELTGQPTDFHTVINGFHFIGLSVSKTEGEHYSEYQRVWLREELEEAVKDDPQKPVFVMHHEHVRDTVYGSTEEDGWGLDTFADILADYPQIVDFSGHSHYPLNDPRSVWQGTFTAVGTGSLNYAEFTVDGENRVHPDGYKKMTQTWIVEVSTDNTVRLRGFDVLSGEKLCEYFVCSPADVRARAFTPEQQRAAATAPRFAADAKPTVRRSFGKTKVTVPAAKSTDGNIVFLYRFTVLDKDGKEVRSTWAMNNYWNSASNPTITQTVEAENGMTVRVTAENAYGMQSAPIEITLS